MSIKLLRMHGHLHHMCTSFARWARCTPGYYDDHRRQVSSLGNLALHNLRIAFQRFDTQATMSHYYLRATNSWMVASMRNMSEMYQKAIRAFHRTYQHASHCRTQSTSDEFLREH